MNQQEISNKLDQFFAANRAEMIADTASLVNINSVRSEALPGMPFGKGSAAALTEAEKILMKHGFSVKNHDNYFITADVLPEEGDTRSNDIKLGMLAHVDVVEAGEGWTYPPYSLTLDRNTEDGITGEIMYGRGTSDDKGPAVAAIYALKAALHVAPLKHGVSIILGGGEETGSEDISLYKKTCKVPPMVFSPDADFPLINIEKGRYAPKFTARISNSLQKPNDVTCNNDKIKLISFSGGETENIVPHKASCTLSGIDTATLSALIEKITEGTELSKVSYLLSERDGDVIITANGKGSHAAFPEGGINAQAALTALLCKLPLSEENNVKHYLEALSELFPFGDTEGKAIGINMSDEKSGALTCAFTVLSIENDFINAQIDIRSPICGTPENVADVVNRALTAKGFSVEQKDPVPPHCTDENSEFVQTLLSSYEAVTGQKGKCLSIGGGTYVHRIDGGVAFGCAMPDTDYRIHGANEFMPVDELITSAKIFATAILRLCCEA